MLALPFVAMSDFGHIVVIFKRFVGEGAKVVARFPKNIIKLMKR
jgi:hypothetical protein